MKRLLFVAAAIVAAGGMAPAAHAGLVRTDLVSSDLTQASDTPKTGSSVLNPILNTIPALSGPDRRHICIISDQVDKSWCFYVAIP